MDQDAALIAGAVAVAGLICYAVGCVVGYVWGYRGGFADAAAEQDAAEHEDAYSRRNVLAHRTAEWDGKLDGHTHAYTDEAARPD